MWRDRVFWALSGAALVLLLCAPVVTLFSMRELQEVGISLSLSCLSFFLLLVTVFLGSTSLWRDIDRRFVVPILTQPIPRSRYLLGKFLAFAIFLGFVTFVLGLAAIVSVLIASQQYPSDRPLVWSSLFWAWFMTWFRYLLLLSVALFFSVFSTSFFLPVFGTIGVYLSGSVSYQVLEYAQRNHEEFSSAFVFLLKVIYCFLPNLSAFDFNVYAIYGLAIPIKDIVLCLVYGVCYLLVLVFLSFRFFARREI
ncbi:MAG: ABC transporter permease [Deltaproteobacteria bacterium]|nr:MAG: ABC transporter permease [Deltaproteobacteria bacterium]